MRDHYDFSKMKGKKNPCVKYLKQPITIRLDKDVATYINLYLRDCAERGRELKVRWAS